ncbi:MAG: hypothetical protein ACR2IE_12065 [Candidatus Sumerlaeaceae bacterium]
MNASSRHLSQIAAAGLICLSVIAYGQVPDPNQELSKKERKQLQQQERQGGVQPAVGQGNIQPQPGQMPQRGPALQQGAPNMPSNPNLNIQGGGAQQLRRGNDANENPNKNVSKQLKSRGEGEIQVPGKPDPSKFQLNQSDDRGQGGNKKKNQGKNVDLGQSGDAPPSPNVTPTIQVQDTEDLSKKELNKQKQQQNRLEEQLNKQNKKNKTPGDDAVASPNATPFVPAGTPPAAGGRLGEGLSKKEQNKLDNQAKKEQNQQEQQAKKEQNELEKLQKKGVATPAAGEPTPAGQIDIGGKGKGKKGKEQPGATPAAGQAQAPADPNATPALSKHDLKKQMKDTKQAEESAQKAAKQIAQLEKKQDKIELKKLSGAEKAVLVGADVSKLNIGASKKLSKNDALTIIGDNNTIIKKKEINKTVINNINLGILPGGWGLPLGGYGYVHQPLIAIDPYCGYCLPSPIHGGFHNLSWNYWDGRSYYDHGYIDSIFMGVGHIRYDGCDGAIVHGRYYCYGWGWIDGCIDYGERRMWVPGFWAPYNVEECGNVPIWIPPVYEEVWTGCCWETVLVDGGYFSPSPSLDCHLVTRHTWVPGHFEYYWA